MNKLLRRFFPRHLSQDKIEFLKLVTIVGHIITSDSLANDPEAREMNQALMKMYTRRTRGVPGLDPDQPED